MGQGVAPGDNEVGDGTLVPIVQTFGEFTALIFGTTLMPIAAVIALGARAAPLTPLARHL